MNTLLALLGGAPAWITYAIVGGLLGLAGSLVGAAVNHALGVKFGRFAVLVGIALTPTITKTLVIPAVEVAYINKDLPRKLDDLTTLLQFSSSNGGYVYTHQLDDAVPEDFDVTLIKQESLSSLCETFGNNLQTGSLASVEYRYHRGADDPKSFFVTAADCL